MLVSFQRALKKVHFQVPTKSPQSTASMDNMHNRLIFDLGKSSQRNEITGKNLSKVIKFENLVAKCCKVRKI